jgi:hypothetical protein
VEELKFEYRYGLIRVLAYHQILASSEVEAVEFQDP